MRTLLKSRNEIDLRLDPGEMAYFRGAFLRGRSFGVPFLPPYPLGSPIARLIHGCYFMNSTSSEDANAAVLSLNGDSGIGCFETLELDAGARYFVHPRSVVAFTFGAGGGFHTQLARLVSPSCWGIHHPLPVIAHGPGTVVLYAENLHPVEVQPGTQAEYIPNQLVAFDCREPFIVKALMPDQSPLTQIVNAIIDDNRICFSGPARLLVSPINRRFSHKARAFLHAMAHLLIVGGVIWLMRQ